MEELSILLVDDEAMERMGLRYLLTKLPRAVRIFEAGSGEQALRILEKQPIDILLTDICMPLMDGLELTRRVREKNPEVSVAICSAYGEFAYAREAMRYGVHTYMLKPVDPEQFSIDVQQLLDEVDERRRKNTETRINHVREELWNLAHRGILTERFRGILEERGMSEKRFCAFVGTICYQKAFFNIETNSEETDEILKSFECALWVKDEVSAAFAALASSASEEKEKLLSKIESGLIEAFGETPDVHAKMVTRASDVKTVLEAMEEEAAQAAENGRVHLSGSDMLPTDMDEMQNSVTNCLNGGSAEEAAAVLMSAVSVLRSVAGKAGIYTKQCVAESIRKLLIYHGVETQCIREAVEAIWDCQTNESLAKTAEKYVSKMPSGEKEDDSRALINRVLLWIHNHYNEELTLDKLAQSVYLTPNYLGLLFKKLTGQTPIHYLMEYRLERVAWFLTHTDQKITDIMTATGYNNPSYLSSIFRSKYGCTPSQYRKKKGTHDERK